MTSPTPPDGFLEPARETPVRHEVPREVEVRIYAQPV